MSQDYIFNFSHGFERSSTSAQDQIRRDNMIRVQGFEPPASSLVRLEHMDEGHGGLPADYGAGTLSEMFNFVPTGGSNTTGDWYGNTAQAMQLFLTNPSQESPIKHNSSSSSSTLHMLLPNTVQSADSTLHHQQNFSTTITGQGHFGPSTQFTWVPPEGTSHEGLSLSLSSSLQHLEATKVEDLRIGDDSAGMLYFNHVNVGDPYRNLHMQGGGGVMGPTHHPIHMGFGSSSLGGVKVLRNSRYLKAAQELLEEFCSVGRGHFKKNKSGSKQNNLNLNPTNNRGGGGGGGDASSSSIKDLPPLSSTEKIEHQRRKVKLSSMLDEVSLSISLSLSLSHTHTHTHTHKKQLNIPVTTGIVIFI
ncbi:hypothetical protein E3N88_01740 [Mikania micrantha]|uniref:POX domain-containing protein n=1 Tax=Mikania micrantha TaxID=192012 RepID=A0A5N6Q1T4_9ASTR|nr:hypothetical protein E3N88_01740 [Mikania micrantha]